MKLLSLLDVLPSEHIIKKNLTSPEQNIHQICLLSSASEAFTEDIIYISPVSVFQEVNRTDAPSAFILINMNPDEPYDEIQLPNNYIIYDGPQTAGTLFTMLLSRLRETNRITEAELAISRALFECTSVEELLDVAASLLGNPVLMQDFTTRLLAHSTIESIPAEDEILNSVFHIGYVTADLFPKYDYANVLEQIKNTPHTFLLKSEKKSDRLIRRLNVNRRYFGWFVTVAYNHPFQEGDMEIMNFLCGALSLFLEKENIVPNMTRKEILLQELIHGGVYSDESFKNRAGAFSWKLHNHYFIVIISASDHFEESHTIMAYKNHLSLSFPDAVIFEENQNLVLFFDVRDLSPHLKSLASFLEKYKLTAAYSCEFKQITDFAYLFQQTLSVLSLGTMLNPNHRLLSYRDYAIYSALQKIAADGNIKYLCMPELITVCRYDKTYGTSFSLSKRLALELASVKLAAQKLNIHRNTMEYRLKKFNEISGIKVYNAAVVEQLLISYKILDLFPSLLDEV